MSSEFFTQEKFHAFLAAYVTGVWSTLTFNPLECLRVRWQVQQQPGDTLKTFVKRVIQNEGLLPGLWKPGLAAYMTSMSLCFGLRMVLYESLRDVIVKVRGGKKDAPTIFFSGLVTGSICYWSVAPLYQIKNRLQGQTGLLLEGVYADGPNKGLTPKYRNTIHTGQMILREEGFTALYTGATALLFRGACYHAGHMLGYDLTKTVFKRKGINDGPYLHFFAGLTSAFTACSAACPADCILNTYQNSPLKSQMGIVRFAGKIARTEGLGFFYRGWSPFFIRVAPLHVIQMPVYEQIRMAICGTYFS